MEGGEGAVVMRKGPWMAEEDEILMEYVKKHGPRDWSSIRSKGLLPRTGKSCRLRWVNKLKPNLKTGCKFSPEEERTVIDLQARFGNKWARIATYLPGRTDNDVKNFWSTRQKRLARLLQSSLNPTKSLKKPGKSPVSQELPVIQGTSIGFTPFGEESSKNGQNSEDILFEPSSSIGGSDIMDGFGELSFQDEFAQYEAAHCLQYSEGLPFFGPQDIVKKETRSSGIPSNFFDDLPIDMFGL
ncbi:hypothetical protein J5N97_029741 [Dioscorea zingiberensis]|uniref:Uncharacterized protein n=1 Tax=Dioscorea zingiberensis TaxID=325984 RepID=A0A9D5BWF4_9LILI|nr:hypothetical protein J5N97_029741 [Dioscorea zingiberensis]